MAAAPVANQAQAVLRSHLCDPAFVHSPLRSSPDTNYSKLKYLVNSSVSEACNNSVLLLGPRGCGKGAVLDMVLEDLKTEHPDAISVIRLNGMLHSDDNCATKEIARQLCLEHQLSFSKMASSDDNTEFMIDMLRECGLAHKTVIFVLEEFDLFAQGKQRLLYSLLDAMQTLTSQAVVIGMSCRLDADQLLEKRVRSRFSHRKLLFVPSSLDDIQRLMERLLMLDKDSSLPTNYVTEYNSRLTSIFGSKKFTGILNSLTDADATTSNILRFLFRVVSYMEMESGARFPQPRTNPLTILNQKPPPPLQPAPPPLEITIAYPATTGAASSCWFAWPPTIPRTTIIPRGRRPIKSGRATPLPIGVSSTEPRPRPSPGARGRAGQAPPVCAVERQE